MGVIHQQAMGENDGLWPAAGLFVKEVDAVDQDGGHIVIPNPRSQVNAPDFGAMDGERGEGTLLSSEFSIPE